MAQPSTLRQVLLRQIAVYNEQHPRAPIDPNAALAVAAQEGLSGRVGDGGHAFGPFQENNAGGVLTGRFPGQNVQQLQAWATSPAGIQDALGRIGGVAGGEHGAQAVRDIVSRFERPANIPREIQGALGALGGVGAQPGGLLRAPAGRAAPALAAAAAGRQAAAVASLPDFRGQLASEFAQAAGTPTNDLSGFYQTLRQALQARAQQQAPPAVRAGTPTLGATVAPPGAPAPAGLPRGQVVGGQGEQASFLTSLAELAAYEHAPVQINSGYRSYAKQAQLYAGRASNPNPVAPPGHSLHEQGLAADGTVNGVPLGTLPAAVLARYGLYTVPGDPVHVQGRR